MVRIGISRWWVSFVAFTIATRCHLRNHRRWIIKPAMEQKHFDHSFFNFRRRDVDQPARLITQTVAFHAVDLIKVRQAAIERKMKNIFG